MARSPEQAARDTAFWPHFKDLLYEVDVLMRVRPHLVRLWRSDDPEQAFLYVVTLEATFVHARVLTEFLVGRPNRRKPGTRKKRPDSDIGANLLLPDWDDHLDRVEVEELDHFCYLLDGALAHLSKRRIEPEMQMDRWVPDINRLFRGLYFFANELVAVESLVGPPLLDALSAPPPQEVLDSGPVAP